MDPKNEQDNFEEQQIKSFDLRTNQYEWIDYKDRKQVCYLNDFLQKHPQINYSALNIQFLDRGFKQTTNYKFLPDEMYRKLARHGHLAKPNVVCKKLKKNNAGQANCYDSSDKFINDEDIYQQKKQVQIQYENFRSFDMGLEEFYKSDFYRKKLNDITMDQHKRKSTLSLQEIGQISKKIKKNIQNKSKNQTK